MSAMILFFVILAATFVVFGIDLKQKRSQLLTKR